MTGLRSLQKLRFHTVLLLRESCRLCATCRVFVQFISPLPRLNFGDEKSPARARNRVFQKMFGKPAQRHSRALGKKALRGAVCCVPCLRESMKKLILCAGAGASKLLAQDRAVRKQYTVKTVYSASEGISGLRRRKE
ncbi:MAG: hypothetical protein EBS01_16680 [Verrucomicrobia bacterium]|nr:hypothetical protein [Verrucomicrobiota bacterium]